MKKIVVLGGSVLAVGNVNPAAEANVSGQFLFVVFPLREITIITVVFNSAFVNLILNDLDVIKIYFN